MKKIITITFFLFFLGNTIQVKAQTGVYRTYDDYLNNKLEVMDRYKGHFDSFSRITYLFKKKGGGSVKIKCMDVWGCVVNGCLFRTNRITSQPVYVSMIGKKTVYYQNGLAYLQICRDNSTTGEYSHGHLCYISKDLNSEIVDTDNTTEVLNKTLQDFLQNLANSNPEYKSLTDCIGKRKNCDGVLECIKTFEAQNK
jgi:hypothetical protein